MSLCLCHSLSPCSLTSPFDVLLADVSERTPTCLRGLTSFLLTASSFWPLPALAHCRTASAGSWKARYVSMYPSVDVLPPFPPSLVALATDAVFAATLSRSRAGRTSLSCSWSTKRSASSRAAERFPAAVVDAVCEFTCVSGGTPRRRLPAPTRLSLRRPSGRTATRSWAT